MQDAAKPQVMEPHEYHLDAGWKDLANQLAVAETHVEEVEAAVKQHDNYGDGRKKALEGAERRVAELQAALEEREETISDPRWGSW